MASSGRWRFESNASFVDWMADEYLSSFVLRDVTPAGQARASVKFTMMLDAGDADVPYRVTATGVRVWSLEGAHGDVDVSFPPPPVVERGLHLVLFLPGKLTLVCDAIDVVRGRAVKRVPPKRAFTEYAYFSVEPFPPTSMETLLAWIGIDATACAFTQYGKPLAREAMPSPSLSPSQGNMIDVLANGAPMVQISWLLGRGSPFPDKLTIARKGGTDEAWRRALDLPLRFPGCRVGATWIASCSLEEWRALLT